MGCARSMPSANPPVPHCAPPPGRAVQRRGGVWRLPQRHQGRQRGVHGAAGGARQPGLLLPGWCRGGAVGVEGAAAAGRREGWGWTGARGGTWRAGSRHMVAVLPHARKGWGRGGEEVDAKPGARASAGSAGGTPAPAPCIPLRPSCPPPVMELCPPPPAPVPVMHAYCRCTRRPALWWCTPRRASATRTPTTSRTASPA